MEGARVRPAQVDDGGALEVVRLVDRARAVVVCERRLVGFHTRFRGFVVDPHPADLAVDVDELGG